MVIWGAGYHFFWLLGMGVVVAVVVLAIVLIVRAASGPAPFTASAGQMPPGSPMTPAARGETPLDILARRFASGEITAEEYQKGRDLLQGGAKS
jgi:uncharacterized membrane protein